jgi:hypothetical protein
MSVLRSKCLSPDTLIALCDELETLPHTQLSVPVTVRERVISHMLMMDQVCEVTLQSRVRAYEGWEKTTWEQALTDNFMVLDGQTQQDDALLCSNITPIPNGGTEGVAHHFLKYHTDLNVRIRGLKVLPGAVKNTHTYHCVTDIHFPLSLTPTSI